MNPPGCSRRQFVCASTAGLLALTQRNVWAATKPKSLPLATAFDGAMEKFVRARKVPGGSLAVVKDGRLVYAKGYGWADRERKISARPDTLFRLASVSKPFTAVAVLKLVETKRLDLKARAFDLLQLTPLPDQRQNLDARLERITIHDLLQHTGGWDREKSFDPMFRSREIARAFGTSGPATPEQIIRYMLGQPLDFEPGTRFAYSNFGYCVLGRVIEKISGQPYEKFVRERVLAPLGITRMRVGASRPEQAAAGEAHYYHSGEDVAKSVFPEVESKVPWPYGGFFLEAMDAHGGWVASAVDVARFAAALDGGKPAALLNPETLAEMVAPPPSPVSRRTDGELADAWYGCGWMVRPVAAGKFNCWHDGSLPGSATLLVRRHDGISYAALFNRRSQNKGLPDGAIDPALYEAADNVGDWGQEDLFPRYF